MTDDEIRRIRADTAVLMDKDGALGKAVAINDKAVAALKRVSGDCFILCAEAGAKKTEVFLRAMLQTVQTLGRQVEEANQCPE